MSKTKYMQTKCVNKSVRKGKKRKGKLAKNCPVCDILLLFCTWTKWT